MTPEQQRTFNAACADLARQIVWHGNRMDKDDWRHFLSGTVLGWRMIPGIDMGTGAPGFVMLGGSSLKLSTDQASRALDIAFAIGDQPWEYGAGEKAVRWSDKILLARGINPNEGFK